MDSRRAGICALWHSSTIALHWDLGVLGLWIGWRVCWGCGRVEIAAVAALLRNDGWEGVVQRVAVSFWVEFLLGRY